MYTFRSGDKNGKAEALTCRSGDLPKEWDNRAHPIQAMLSAKKFLNPILCHTAVKHSPDIRITLKSDSLTQEIMTAQQNRTKRHSKVPLEECTIDNNLFYMYVLLYISDNETLYREIIHTHHDHPVRAATYELVSRNYWWPTL